MQNKGLSVLPQPGGMRGHMARRPGGPGQGSEAVGAGACSGRKESSLAAAINTEHLGKEFRAHQQVLRILCGQLLGVLTVPPSFHTVS